MLTEQQLKEYEKMDRFERKVYLGLTAIVLVGCIAWAVYGYFLFDGGGEIASIAKLATVAISLVSLMPLSKFVAVNKRHHLKNILKLQDQDELEKEEPNAERRKEISDDLRALYGN